MNIHQPNESFTDMRRLLFCNVYVWSRSWSWTSKPRIQISLS